MHERVKKIAKHPLVYGGSIMIIGNLLVSFFYFLFNLFMSRNLSVVEYGVLASITSLIGFPMLIANAITPTIVRFAGSYFATGDLVSARGLYVSITKFILLISIGLSLIFLIFLTPIGNFFHIENRTLLLVTDIIIFISIISFINGAFLQAKLAFGFQVITGLVSSLSKFILGVIFILMGFSITGATTSILFSVLVGYVVSFIPLDFVFHKKVVTPKIQSRELFAYGLPSALTFFGLTSLISTDIILVKHFFDPVQAGLYAGLSLIGRVIFYISGPIGNVMFPLIVQKHERNETVGGTLQLSLIFILLPSILLTIFYFLFPGFVIAFFLKNETYLQVIPFIGFFGLFIAIYSVLSLLANFYLSIKKTIIYIPILIGAFAQIVLIFLYHMTFTQIISISLSITFLLVICLLLYYPYATKKH